MLLEFDRALRGVLSAVQSRDQLGARGCAVECTRRMDETLLEDTHRGRADRQREPGVSGVFPSARDCTWTKSAHQSWSRRVFERAAAAGRPDATPYTGRHSYASLLLHEGRSVIYMARQLGHDANLTLSTYGHVIEELDDAPRANAETVIRATRGEEVPSRFPRAV